MENKSILIVEDEQITAMDLKDTLLSLGYRVTGIASSGEQAIKMVDAETPDLILMDIQLSGPLTGIDAAQQILEHHPVPVIFVTAYGDPEIVEKAKQTRPYGYIIKPYDERTVRIEIEIALYKFELDRMLNHEYENLEQRVIDRTNDLRLANAALQKSELRYRLLFERSGEGIFIFNATGKYRGRIIEVNAAGAAMHGYVPEELLKMTIMDLDCDKTTSPFPFEAVLRGEWVEGEIDHVRKDGSVFPLEFHAGLVELDGDNYVFSVMRDVSEKKRVIKEIVRARDEWERTFDAVPDLIAIIDTDFRVLRMNRSMANRLGISPDHAAGLKCYEVVHHSSGPPAICPHRMLLSDGQEHTVDIHEDLLNADFSLTVSPIRDSSGTVIGSVHILHDITKRKRAEEALRESEEKYRTILVNMQDLFYRTDLNGKITMISPAGARFAGYDSPDELIGMDVTAMYVDPENRSKFLSDLTEKGTVSAYPLTLKVRDGSIRYVVANSHYYRDARGTILGVEGIIHDITGLRHAKDALRIANKKLNLLSGITRHDIRNQLMALKMYIELAKTTKNPDKLKDFFSREEQIADTIEGQINFTLDYEDMGVKSPQWQNVDEVFRTAASEQSLREIRIEASCKDLEIIADPLLQKVFFNIIDNALRYGGPKMTVIRISTLESDKGLTIAIEDDGAGISVRDKKRLFERGFGHHTGLGLFLSREILSITGSTITETGAPGAGARFEILVPRGRYRFREMTGGGKH